LGSEAVTCIGGTCGQTGAALVEMAIGLVLFLLLVFGVLEFALAIFDWSKEVEATRAGARYAIVNDPACDIYGEGALPSCPGGDTIDPDNCPGASIEVTPAGCNADPDDAACRIAAVMRNIMPRIADGNVRIVYGCSDAGYRERPFVVPTVTVRTSGVEHNFLLPGLLGIEATVTLPGFSTTRTGEDLYTPTG
jgi:hypothetical protein